MASVLLATIGLSSGATDRFDVRSFGAKGDGRTDGRTGFLGTVEVPLHTMTSAPASAQTDQSYKFRNARGEDVGEVSVSLRHIT